MSIIVCVSEPMTAVKPSVSMKKTVTRPLRPVEQSSIDHQVSQIQNIFAHLWIGLYLY